MNFFKNFFNLKEDRKEEVEEREQKNKSSHILKETVDRYNYNNLNKMEIELREKEKINRILKKNNLEGIKDIGKEIEYVKERNYLPFGFKPSKKRNDNVKIKKETVKNILFAEKREEKGDINFFKFLGFILNKFENDKELRERYNLLYNSILSIKEYLGKKQFKKIIDYDSLDEEILDIEAGEKVIDIEKQHNKIFSYIFRDFIGNNFFANKSNIGDSGFPFYAGVMLLAFMPYVAEINFDFDNKDRMIYFNIYPDKWRKSNDNYPVEVIDIYSIIGLIFLRILGVDIEKLPEDERKFPYFLKYLPIDYQKFIERKETIIDEINNEEKIMEEHFSLSEETDFDKNRRSLIHTFFRREYYKLLVNFFSNPENEKVFKEALEEIKDFYLKQISNKFFKVKKQEEFKNIDFINRINIPYEERLWEEIDL